MNKLGIYVAPVTVTYSNAFSTAGPDEARKLVEDLFKYEPSLYVDGLPVLSLSEQQYDLLPLITAIFDCRVVVPLVTDQAWTDAIKKNGPVTLVSQSEVDALIKAELDHKSTPTYELGDLEIIANSSEERFAVDDIKPDDAVKGQPFDDGDDYGDD